MTLRDEFEAYIRTRKLCTKYGAKLDLLPDGQYRDIRVRGHYSTYQSAHAKQQKRIDELEAELAEMKRNAHAYLSQASEDVAGWGAYASDYFQNKHDLDFDIKLYQQRAEEFITATAQEGKDGHTLPNKL